MKILMTSFDAFGGERLNPAEMAVSCMPKEIDGAELVFLTVPTVFGEAVERVLQAMNEEKPDAVLAVGQAGGRTGLSVERIAVNRKEASIPDNAGNQPTGVSIEDNGPDALFATVPVQEMMLAMRDAGVPAQISETAGLFVCNELLYGILYAQRERKELQGGFIHIPYTPEQAVSKPNVASMSTQTVVRGLTAAVRALVAAQRKKDGLRRVDVWDIPEEEADAYIEKRERYAALATKCYEARSLNVRRDFQGSEDGEAVVAVDETGEIAFLLHLDPYETEAMQKAEAKGDLEAYFLGE